MASALSELWRLEPVSSTTVANLAPFVPKPEERTLFRPSRTAYPGSRFGPKSRYDLPQRHKAYGNGDEAEAVLYSGSSLEPPGWTQALTPRLATPRLATGASLGGAARAMLHPLAEKNLPELPLVDERNDVHGVLVLGGVASGKTSLVLSLMAVLSDSFPTRHDPQLAEKRKTMPAHGGQCYELPVEQDVRFESGNVRRMRVVLTDTPPCGTDQRQEQPLCATVSPNSTQHYNAIPSWMRITLRSGNFPHYSVVFVLDALTTPLWEDAQRCRDLVRLISVLRRSQYTVCLAVTKLLKARENALRDAAHGKEHAGQVGHDPRSSYEAYASRYLERVCAAVRAKARENDWPLSPQGASDEEAPSCAFPIVNLTIFDVPTWVSIGDYRSWQERKGTAVTPNMKYYVSQLRRLLVALSLRSHAE